MSNQAGKGDSPRPVNRAAWDAAWERIEASKLATVKESLPVGPAAEPTAEESSVDHLTKKKP